MTSNKKNKTNHLTEKRTTVINNSTNILKAMEGLYRGIISKKEN